MIFLIVDDNANARKLIREILEQNEDKIFECSDGLDAIEFYKLHKPDWVLMDVKMKNMDGITATKKIIEDYPDANVIIVSSYDDLHLKKNAEQAGAKAYVLKDSLIKLSSIIVRISKEN